MDVRTPKPVEPTHALESRVRSFVQASLDARVIRVEPLAGALGLRQFARVWLESATDAELPATLIARIEAPEDPQRRPAGIPPEPPLEPIRALLEDQGLPVPRSFAADPGAGIDLLGDFGDYSLSAAAAASNGIERDALYRLACALVPRLQAIDRAPGVAAFDRQLDATQMDYKAQRFAQWSLRSAGPAGMQVVRDAFALIADEVLRAPQRLAHRDFQSANLFVIDVANNPTPPTIQPSSPIAMIDLQGAFMAPPEYDLVCLLRDSYVELPASSVAARIAEVRPLLPDAPDPETFSYRFDLLTLTRKGKDHALYQYAAAELGDDRYQKYLPVAHRALLTAASRVAAQDHRFARLAELITESAVGSGQGNRARFGTDGDGGTPCEP
jgi:aminoglycoside/choline kinase family phosphotransferase